VPQFNPYKTEIWSETIDQLQTILYPVYEFYLPTCYLVTHFQNNNIKQWKCEKYYN